MKHYKKEGSGREETPNGALTSQRGVTLVGETKMYTYFVPMLTPIPITLLQV